MEYNLYWIKNTPGKSRLGGSDTTKNCVGIPFQSSKNEFQQRASLLMEWFKTVRL